jgi:hypothetical protein
LTLKNKTTLALFLALIALVLMGWFSYLGTEGRRYEGTMNLRKSKTHNVSFHSWGWTARPFPLRFAVAGEAFVLTSLLIERDDRRVEICSTRPYRRI